MLTWAGDPGKQIPIVEGGVVPSAAQTVAYSFLVAGTREKPISPKMQAHLGYQDQRVPTALPQQWSFQPEPCER